MRISSFLAISLAVLTQCAFGSPLSDACTTTVTSKITTTTTATSKITTTTTKYVTVTTTKYTTSKTTTTTSHSATPTLPACNGQQRYNLTVYTTAENAFLGYLYAEIADGGITELQIAYSPPNPNNAFHLTEWNQSSDAGKIVAYVPPNPPVYVNPNNYLAIGTNNGIDKDGEDYVETTFNSAGDQFNNVFACSKIQSGKPINCTIPGTHGKYTFTASQADENGVNYYAPNYAVVGKVNGGDLPVYINAVKSCK